MAGHGHLRGGRWLGVHALRRAMGRQRMDPGPTNPSGRLPQRERQYTGGPPIATACRHWGCPSYDANRNCIGQRRWLPATGMFTIRIYGKVCRAVPANVPRCWDLNKPAPPAGFLAVVQNGGYRATFGSGPDLSRLRGLFVDLDIMTI